MFRNVWPGRQLIVETEAHLNLERPSREQSNPLTQTASHALAEFPGAQSQSQLAERCASSGSGSWESNRMAQADTCQIGNCQNTDTLMGITLVTVVTRNRLPALKRLCDAWPGRMIAVLSVGNVDPMAINGFGARTEHMDCTIYCARAIVVFGTFAGPHFPINKLRNLGVAAVSTSHMLYLDADFLPSSDMYTHLTSQLSHPMFQNSKAAVVVPAFEFIAENSCPKIYKTVKACQSWVSKMLPLVPQYFEDVVRCVEGQRCQLFHSASLSGDPTMGYDEWVTQGHKMGNTRTQGHQLRRIQCFRSEEFEPFLLIRTCGCMPKLFDEAFKGYDKTRVQMVELLRLVGYEFYVLPKEFLFHIPHRGSGSQNDLNGNAKTPFKKQWRRWKKLAHERFGERLSRTRLCPDKVTAEGFAHNQIGRGQHYWQRYHAHRPLIDAAGPASEARWADSLNTYQTRKAQEQKQNETKLRIKIGIGE